MSAIPYQYSVGSLSLVSDTGSTVQLTLTTEAKFDGSAPFTIGLWIRILVADSPTTNPGQTVLFRPNAFTLSLQNSYVCWTWANERTAAASSIWPLAVDQWHYVAISYNTPTTDGDDAIISMYIDGAPALLPPVPTNYIGNDAMQPLALGMGGEVASLVCGRSRSIKRVAPQCGGLRRKDRKACWRLLTLPTVLPRTCRDKTVRSLSWAKIPRLGCGLASISTEPAGPWLISHPVRPSPAPRSHLWPGFASMACRWVSEPCFPSATGVRDGLSRLRALGTCGASSWAIASTVSTI